VTEFSPRTRAFLAAYIESGGRLTKAAEAAKVTRFSHYRRLEKSPEYRAAFEQAREQAADLLEEEAVMRAKEGDLRPVFWKGKPVGAIREKSDTLLMFLLRGAKPEKYRERFKHEVSGHLNVTRFKGTIQDLLATYRELTQAGDAVDQ
jgi:hypothetical protein